MLLKDYLKTFQTYSVNLRGVASVRPEIRFRSIRSFFSDPVPAKY